MADKTSAGSGNWGTAGTWSPSGVPTAGQTVDILSGHTVTVAATPGANPGIVTIGVDNGAETMGALVLGTDVTFTAGGEIIVGQGSGNAGTLTLGEGSTLALGSNHLTLNNAKFNSTSTTDSWATVTGSGSVRTGTTVRAAQDYFQEIDLEFVSFQHTGTVEFRAGGSTGGSGTGLVNKVEVNNCVFVGQSTITAGLSGYTPLADNIFFENCDFRELTGAGANTRALYLYGLSGVATGLSYVNGCTFSQTTKMQFYLSNRRNWQFTNNVLYNFGQDTTNASTAGTTFTGNIFMLASGATSSDGSIMVNDSGYATTVSGNYFYADYANPHIIKRTGTDTTVPSVFEDNVFEVVYNGNGANCVLLGVAGSTITGNVLIGSGSVGSKTSSGGYGLGVIVIKNNTICFKDTQSGDYPALYDLEHLTNTVTPTSVTIANNLLSGSVAVAKGIGAIDNYAQTITYSDYNDFHNVTANYYSPGNLTISGGLTHDMDEVAPDFVDPTRCISAYSTLKGGAGTASDALTNLLLQNGYSSSGGHIQDSTVQTAYSSAELVSWVRAGFAPRNLALQGTGDPLDGSPDIGAVQVLTEAEEPPPGPQPEPEISVTFEGYITASVDAMQVWKKIFDPTTSRLRFTAQLRG